MVKLNLKIVENIPVLTATSYPDPPETVIVRVKIRCEYIDIPYFVKMIREAADYMFKFDWTWLN